jgi:hypothetical protein
MPCNIGLCDQALGKNGSGFTKCSVKVLALSAMTAQPLTLSTGNGSQVRRAGTRHDCQPDLIGSRV